MQWIGLGLITVGTILVLYKPKVYTRFGLDRRLLIGVGISIAGIIVLLASP